MPSTKKILPNQSLVDFVVSEYGTVEGLFVLALQNGIGITDDIDAETVLIAPEASFTKRASFLPLPKSSNEPIIKSAIARQTMLDVAVQYVGDLSALFQIAMLNGKGITDSIEGEAVIMPAIMNEQVVKSLNGYFPASRSDSEELAPGGIGFMQIQNDFKVS